MRKVLIDTNIYSHAIRGDSDVIEILKKSDKIGFTVISIGELIAGFKAGKNELNNREMLTEFLDSPRVVVLPIDENTAEFFGEIFNNLKKTGKPIPTNDIWIAAIAFQHGLKIVSKDRHFRHISGLPLLEM